MIGNGVRLPIGQIGSPGYLKPSGGLNGPAGNNPQNALQGNQPLQAEQAQRCRPDRQGKQQDQMILQMIRMLLDMVRSLFSLLNRNGGANGGGGCSGGSCGGGIPFANEASPKQEPLSSNSNNNEGMGPGELSQEPNTNRVEPASEAARIEGVNDPRVQRHINELASDPEGQNLLEAARQRGVKIDSGPVKEGTLAHFDPNQNKIVLGEETLQRGTGLKSLIHELVHATTPHDGNSKHEEGMANVIADRIASRANSNGRNSANNIYNDTISRYPELPRFNGNFDNNINRVLRGSTRQPYAVRYSA